jgi:hypothetical protein
MAQAFQPVQAQAKACNCRLTYRFERNVQVAGVHSESPFVPSPLMAYRQ